MELLLCTKLLLVLSIVKAEQLSNSKHDEKNTTKRGVIVVNSPKTRHNAAMLVFGEEESGDDETKKSIAALSTNMESLNNLVQTQSEVIRNLGLQVAEFRRRLDPGKVNELSTIGKNNTKNMLKIKKTVKSLKEHVSLISKEAHKNTADGEKMLQTLEQKLAFFQEKVKDITGALERRLGKITHKIDRVDRKVNKLKTQSQKPGWPRGNYCILAKGSCPLGFRRRHGYLRSVYLYAPGDNYIKPTKFGSSWIGCYGNYCGQYGNFIGSINIVACCK